MTKKTVSLKKIPAAVPKKEAPPPQGIWSDNGFFSNLFKNWVNKWEIHYASFYYTAIGGAVYTVFFHLMSYYMSNLCSLSEHAYRGIKGNQFANTKK